MSSIFAQALNQRARKIITSAQAMTELTAAAFILVTTKSPVAIGRVARNGGRDRSLAQGSGLANALPITTASNGDKRNAQARIHQAACGSVRKRQEIGTNTHNRVAPTLAGNRD